MFGSKNNSVGIIGLGIIGSRVAERLRNADFNVFVWNRSIKPVPNFMASPAEVAEVAPVIQIFVRDAEALMAVMEDMKPALTKRHVVLCHSTVNARAIRRAAAIANEAGAGFLDAPFTGSKSAAEQGQLVYYIGGEKADLDKALSILEISGKKFIPLGKPGDATVLKIATNLISAAVVEALAEAMAITKAEGIDIARLQEALADNANSSALITMKLPNMAARSYAPHFSLKNMLKDARYAQAIADEQGLALPVLNASAQAMERGVRAGQGEFDYTVVMENFTPMLRVAEERAARLKPKAEPAKPAEPDALPSIETKSGDLPPAGKEAKPASDKTEAKTGEAEPKTGKHAKLLPASLAADHDGTEPGEKVEKTKGGDKDKSKGDAPKDKVEPVTKEEKPADKPEASPPGEAPVKEGPPPIPATEAAEPLTAKEAVPSEDGKVPLPAAKASEPAKQDEISASASKESLAEKKEEPAKKEELTASGLPKPPAIAKAGLKPTAPSSSLEKSQTEPKATAASTTSAGQSSQKLQVTAPVKQPSLVSRFFKGITGMGKKSKKVQPAPAHATPPPIKAFKSSGTGREPGLTSGKLVNAEPRLMAKLTESPLAAILVSDQEGSKEEKHEVPAKIVPPPISETETKATAAPESTPLPSVAVVPEEAKTTLEEKATAVALLDEATLPPVLVTETSTEKEEEKEPAATLKEESESAPQGPVVTNATDSSLVLPVEDIKAITEPAPLTSGTESPAILENTAAAPPSKEEPVPVHDGKTAEESARELAEKFSAFPKIPERKIVAPAVETEAESSPAAPSEPPQTRLLGIKDVVVPNLAPSPPPPFVLPAAEEETESADEEEEEDDEDELEEEESSAIDTPVEGSAPAAAVPQSALKSKRSRKKVRGKPKGGQ